MQSLTLYSFDTQKIIDDLSEQIPIYFSAKNTVPIPVI